MWFLTKHKLKGKRILKLRTLIDRIRQIWRSLSVSYAEKLVESVPRRYQAIIANAGDWTRY